MKSRKTVKKSKQAEKKSFGIFPFLILSMIGIALCFVSYYSLQSGLISEDKLSKYTGEVIYKDVVTETYPMTRDPETGVRERPTKDFFHLRLKGLTQTLVSYNMEEDYHKLENALTLGDQITVLFESTSLYKVEKNGVVILDDKGKRLRNKIVGFIAGIGAALVFWQALTMSKKTSA